MRKGRCVDADPLNVKIDLTKSLRFVIRELIDAAKKMDAESTEKTTVEMVLRHLVEANLSLASSHSSRSSILATSDRGCFIIGDVVIHVSSLVCEAVIHKCQRDLDDGKRPIVITTSNYVLVFEELADIYGLAGYIDVFDIEQFLAIYLYELGGVTFVERTEIVRRLIDIYNAIVESSETGPSVKIRIGTS